MDTRLFLQEDERLKNYELSSQRQIEKNKDETELGYRDVNTRFLEMEKAAFKRDEWAQKEEEHKVRKQNLETAWHKSPISHADSLPLSHCHLGKSL